MRRIFISYRRDDSAAVCGSIYEWLREQYGKESLFKDVDNIPLGLDFGEYIERSIKQSSVELVIIGPKWLEVRNASGERRLDDPNDVVRIEVEAALRRGLQVIPVLVDGASLPSADQLPESLQPLLRVGYFVVRSGNGLPTDMLAVRDAIETGDLSKLHDGVAYADFGARFGGYLLDGLILSVPLLVIYFIGIAVVTALVAQSSTTSVDSGASTAATGIFLLAYYAISIVLGCGYFGVQWSRTGQTIGQRVAHIKVVGVDGKPISFWRGVLRYVVGMWIVDLCTLYVGYLWPLWDKQHQALHDKVARTLVVKA
jgi:uncharacterized RDD family membrane protein YckC